MNSKTTKKEGAGAQSLSLSLAPGAHSIAPSTDEEETVAESVRTSTTTSSSMEGIKSRSSRSSGKGGKERNRASKNQRGALSISSSVNGPSSKQGRDSRLRKEDDEDEEEDEEEADQAGAINVPGSDPAAAADVHVISGEENIDNDGDHLVEAQLAPKVFEATSVEVEKDAPESKSSKGRLILALLFVVLVIGVVVGLTVRDNSSTETANDEALTGETAPPEPSPTAAPTVEDPYEEGIAYRGYNADWSCSNSTSVEGYSSCILEPEREFPYRFYQSFLECLCPEPIGSVEDGASLPTNDNGCRCDIAITPPGAEGAALCLYAHFVESTSEEVFQITFDCSNIFYTLDLVSTSPHLDCAGRNETGDCFPVQSVPAPPETYGSPVNVVDLAEWRCAENPFSNNPDTFELLRGRYDCTSPLGVPFPGTNMRALTFCTEPGPLRDENSTHVDCNCAIFLGQLNLASTCQSCQVIPADDASSSNETLPSLTSYRLAYDCSDRFKGSCVGYDVNGDCIDSDSVPPVCTYRDVESCAEKAAELGLFLGGGGFPFAAVYNTKGCYYYASDHPAYPNMAFFGLGATAPQQLESTPNQGNLRLVCEVTELLAAPESTVCEIFDEDVCREVAESQGVSFGNPEYPDLVINTDVVGCYYFPVGSGDPLRENVAFFNLPAENSDYEFLTLSATIATRFLCS